MKPFFLPLALVIALSGCVAMPYDDAYLMPYSGYATAPVYPQPAYAGVPGYVQSGPVYGPPVYVGPPIRFGFGLNYRSGRGGYHGHYHGHHHRRGLHAHRFGHAHHGGRGR